MSLITVKAAFHLMISNPTLCALQFSYEERSFEANFETLKTLLLATPPHSISLAPELCLSGYSYEHIEEAALFSQTIFPELLSLSSKRTFGLTMIERHEHGYHNTFHLFHEGKCLYSRPKAKLFPLGDEEKHFIAGKTEEIAFFELNGIKIAVLICFEVRFPHLWEQIKGADLILVPAYWGSIRKKHLEILTDALAVANQAYIICANSADKTMAKSSAIITPWGERIGNDLASCITHLYDPLEIKKMRRYLNIGMNV